MRSIRVPRLQETSGGEPEHPAEGEEGLGSLHHHQRAVGERGDQIGPHAPGSVVMSPQGRTTAKGTRIRKAVRTMMKEREGKRKRESLGEREKDSEFKREERERDRRWRTQAVLGSPEDRGCR